MPGIFVSHARVDTSESQAFVDAVLHSYAGVNLNQVFYSTGNARVPDGSLRDSRIFSAEADAAVVILYATPAYFESYYCALEAGLSLARNDGAFAFLSPGLSFSQIPEHLQSFGWRYSHDQEAIERLADFIRDNPNIDKKKVCSLNRRAALNGWIDDARNMHLSADAHLNNFKQTFPHILDHTPYTLPGSGRRQTFGRVSWELESGEVVPVVWAANDQTSLMNNNNLISDMQRLCNQENVFGLWPEEDGFGVAIHTGQGGTLLNQGHRLKSLGIPLPSLRDD